jgi:uncharacterized membrane protein
MQSKIRKLKTYDKTAAVLLLLSIFYTTIVIIKNFGDPLWYDEAWRADLIRIGSFNSPYSHAPVSLGYFLIIRFFDIFSETNFSQRLLNYLALLALPFVVYWFCRLYFDRTFARIMIVLTFLSTYVIENSVVAKPYLLDVVLTLVFIIAYRKFVEGKLKPALFILISLIFCLTSFAALFFLPAVLVLLIFRYKRSKNRDAKPIIIWAASWISLSIIQIELFIRPQIRHLLGIHWSGLFLSGNPWTILVDILGNLASIFGLIFGINPNIAVLEDYTIFWDFPQIKIFGLPVLGTSTVIGVIFLAVFIYGCYSVFKKSKPELLAIILLVYLFEVFAALLQKWPFGDARSNIFSLFPLYIIFFYGLYNLVREGTKSNRIIKILTASLLLVSIVLLFPFDPMKNLISNQSNYSQPEIGVQSNAIYIAKYSKPEDTVLVDNLIGPLGFQYYYQFSDYTNQYRSNEARNVIYGLKPKSYVILPNLKKTHPKTIWIVTDNSYPGYIVSRDIVKLQAYGYRLTSKYENEGDLTQRFNLSS